MLWESTNPTAALQARFGFDDFDHAARWLSDALADRWAIEVRACDRILISSGNAIAWVQTGRGPLVVKWSVLQDEFVKLAATADLIHALDQQGVPVAAPVRSVHGDRRVVVRSGLLPLSMTVLPAVEGDLLDVTDQTAVHAAGACLARLHLALSSHDDPRLQGCDRRPVPDLGSSVEGWLSADDPGRTPGASARLRDLIADLPAIDAPVQLIHRDYRSANILTAGRQIVAVLDFDDVRPHYCVYDLAHAATMLATRFTDWSPTPRRTRESLQAGYRSVRRLTPAEELWLEPLILWLGIGQVPPGDDPAGWAKAVSVSSG